MPLTSPTWHSRTQDATTFQLDNGNKRQMDSISKAEPLLVGTTANSCQSPTSKEEVAAIPTNSVKNSDYYKSSQWYSHTPLSPFLHHRLTKDQVPRRHNDPHLLSRKYSPFLHSPSRPPIPTTSQATRTLLHPPQPRARLRLRISPLLQPHRTLLMPHPRLRPLPPHPPNLPVRARNPIIPPSDLADHGGVHNTTLPPLQPKRHDSFLRRIR